MKQIALVGFGFMGGMHAQVYRLLQKAGVAAIADANVEAARQRAGMLGLDVPIFSTLEEMLAQTSCDAVDICLPTDLHKDAALQAMAAGKHVFCEKPLALSERDAEEMVARAETAGIIFQVGHCIRFWPEYAAFAEFLKSGRAGRLLSLTMQRRSGRVTGSAGNWILDEKRSLGAVLDLHIHDTDWVHHLLGAPLAVTSCGSREEFGWNHVFTHYHFDGVVVQAEGGWNYPAQWGFQMAFQAIFENGAVEYDSGAQPTLRATLGENQSAALPFSAPQAGSSAIEGGNISSLGGYYNELEYFIDCLERGVRPEISTGPQALRSLRTVLAEIESLKTGQMVKLK